MLSRVLGAIPTNRDARGYAPTLNHLRLTTHSHFIHKRSPEHQYQQAPITSGLDTPGTGKYQVLIFSSKHSIQQVLLACWQVVKSFSA